MFSPPSVLCCRYRNFTNTSKVLYPLVVVVNTLSNGLLRIFGIHHHQSDNDKLNSEELRTIVNEASGLIPAAHQEMLLSILDLEKVSVEDIMVPRNEVVGIDIEDSIEEIIEQICQSRHTRMPVYNGEINKVIGILHARHAANLGMRAAAKDGHVVLLFDVFALLGGCLRCDGGDYGDLHVDRAG